MNKLTWLIIISSAGCFTLGRATAPKSKPEIKIIDNSKSIEQAMENTRKQMLEEQHKQIVIERHTEKNKAGDLKSDVKQYITYNKNTSESMNQKTTDNIKIAENKNIIVKQISNGIDYTFMVGRSLIDLKYDYIASMGVPLFGGLKANAGYEFNDRKIFVGATLNF